MTTTISSQDFIASIAESLQYISYTHPRDFVQAMARAYDGKKAWQHVMPWLKS